MLFCAISFTGCSDDNDELMGKNSGYIQFKLYKAASQIDALSKASIDNELEYLRLAKKIKLELSYKGSRVTQTLNLNSYNDAVAEFGLRSDKLELIAGSYSIIGYYLYDEVDNQLITGSVEDNTFSVTKGGLNVKNIPVSVKARGMVNFTLVKDFSNFTKSSNSYLFSNVRKADITVKNLFSSKETTFSNIKMSYKTVVEGNGSSHQSAIAVSDSVLYLEAGRYAITKYNVYNYSGNLLENNESVSNNEFTILDNKLADAEVPVTMNESAENIKDYFALKAIWEALDGENWSYYGESSPMGINWNFNKDIDMWGNQPGVGLDSNGRVTTMSLGGFGPRGDVPAAIGQLSELKVLTLGTHSDMIGGGDFSSRLRSSSTEDRQEMRMNYYNMFHKKDRRASFSADLQTGFAEMGIKVGNAKPLYSIKKASRDVADGDLNNAITSIPEEIGKLTKLEVFYIANGHISSLPNTLGTMESLTDLEIYNCPKMTTFPSEINALPRLEVLNIARNRQMSGEEFFRGLDDFAKNAKSNKLLQILYSGFNNLEEIPASFSNMEKIGLLEMTNNKIKKIHPLGKGVNPVQILLDNNEITEIPVDAEGYYCGTDDIELFSAADNKLTTFPNIFTANTVYTIEDIDFSFNQIASIEGEDNGTFKGFNVQTLTLSGNKLTQFPNIFFNVGSIVSNLNLSGNYIEEFKGGDSHFYGKYLHNLESIDLGYNKLSKLPSDFSARKLPYLYGFDVSYNRFSDFPYGPLNISRLTVMAIRHQRDENGNRSLRTWPTGIYTCPSLRAFYISGNDLRKIEDTISYMIYIFDVKDNPNIVLDVTDVCYYIQAGSYNLIYDPSHDIRGCDALTLDN